MYDTKSFANRHSGMQHRKRNMAIPAFKCSVAGPHAEPQNLFVYKLNAIPASAISRFYLPCTF